MVDIHVLMPATTPTLPRPPSLSPPLRMSFLSLPRELRNIIYAYLSVPFAPPSAFSGLYLSCKHIKAEYDFEHALSLRTYIHTLQSHSLPQDILISLAEPLFVGSPKLHISLATRTFTDYPTSLQDPSPLVLLFKSILDQVLSKHFVRVTITFHETDNVQFGIDNIRWIHQHLVLNLPLQLSTSASTSTSTSADHIHINTRHIVVEPPSPPGPWLNRWLRLAASAGPMSRGWMPEWQVTEWRTVEERGIGLVWGRWEEERKEGDST